MSRWVVALALLGGCDSLFGLDHIKPTDGGAGPDDNPGDVITVPVDASCVAGPDEDSDGIPDDCDACPTVPSTTMLDTDADGLPDICDPDLGANKRDTIVFKAMFATADDLNAFTVVNGAYDSANKGIVTIAGNGTTNGTLLTNTVYVPTKIEVNVAGFASTATTDTVMVGSKTVQCVVYACSSGTCASIQPGGSISTLGKLPSTITQIDLMSVSGSMQCAVKASGAQITPTLQAGFTPSAVGVQTSSTTGVKVFVKSLVVYGSL